MFNSLRTCLLAFLAAAALCAVTVSAYATEGGGGAYANGAEDSMSGNIPPHGFWYINYTNFYHADSFKDNDGDTLMDDDQFEANIFANISRFAYTSNIQVLGGSLGGYLLLPYVNANVKTPAGSETKTGLGDITIAPFISWHRQEIHWAVAVDLVMPTGAYDKDDIANIGRNYYTVEPLLAVTYLPKNGLELTGKFMYDFNTENTDTDYTSGQEFHIDYTAAYHMGPWAVGANGYYYKQITDDEIDGDTVEDNKGQAMGLGPMLSYSASPANSFIIKYQKEFEVKNRPCGEKVWIKGFIFF